MIRIEHRDGFANGQARIHGFLDALDLGHVVVAIATVAVVVTFWADEAVSSLPRDERVTGNSRHFGDSSDPVRHGMEVRLGCRRSAPFITHPRQRRGSRAHEPPSDVASVPRVQAPLPSKARQAYLRPGAC